MADGRYWGHSGHW
jgi:transcriptional regulator with XRE-family HTH domain